MNVLSLHTIFLIKLYYSQLNANVQLLTIKWQIFKLNISKASNYDIITCWQENSISYDHISMVIRMSLQALVIINHLLCMHYLTFAYTSYLWSAAHLFHQVFKLFMFEQKAEYHFWFNFQISFSFAVIVSFMQNLQ